MKKFYFVLIIAVSLLVSSCSVFRYSSQSTITDQDQISQIIKEYYPALQEYQDEGVIKIASVKEQTLGSGETQYDVKYQFVNNYYEGEELVNLLKEKYPDVYKMYQVGMIKDLVAYKFVDGGGSVANMVSYNKVRRPRAFFRPPFNRNR